VTAGPGSARSAAFELIEGPLLLVDADATSVDPGDDVAFAWLLEERCRAVDVGVIVLTWNQHGPLPVRVEATDGLPPPEAGFGEAEYVVEVSGQVASGRMRIAQSWELETASTIEVSTGPLRFRVAWSGLGDAVAYPPTEEIDVTVAPGAPAPVAILRSWPGWQPPSHERTLPDGRRVLSGPRAVERRATLKPVDRLFWDPYPRIDGGYVTSLWEDPKTDTRWASGNVVPGGHGLLRELNTDEASDLFEAGFPNERTYVRDADGRVWTSDLLPLSRAKCLNLVSADRLPTLQAFGLAVEIDELPPGWGRIARFTPETGRVQVDAVNDEPGVFWQRWRDDQPLPPR
jgi:hypothetical protein